MWLVVLEGNYYILLRMLTSSPGNFITCCYYHKLHFCVHVHPVRHNDICTQLSCCSIWLAYWKGKNCYPQLVAKGMSSAWLTPVAGTSVWNGSSNIWCVLAWFLWSLQLWSCLSESPLALCVWHFLHQQAHGHDLQPNKIKKQQSLNESSVII